MSFQDHPQVSTAEGGSEKAKRLRDKTIKMFDFLFGGLYGERTTPENLNRMAPQMEDLIAILPQIFAQVEVRFGVQMDREDLKNGFALYPEIIDFYVKRLREKREKK